MMARLGVDSLLSVALTANSLVIAAPPKALNVVMSSRGAVCGLAVGETGQPLRNMDVRFTSRLQVVTAKTDSNGKFEAPDVGPGLHLASIN